MAIEEVIDDTFEEKVLRWKIPVVVHFWAAWCEECGTIRGFLNDLAPGYESRLAFVAMDVEKWNTPERYIRGIPTLMVFKDLGTATGSEPPNSPAASKIKDFSKEEIKDFLDEQVGGKRDFTPPGV